MKQQKEVKISYWAAHLTTVVSVTLVLVLAGIITLISLGAEKETRRIKENLEITLILADTVSNEKAMELAQRLEAEPYSQNVTLITKEEALKSWKDDTGEDLEALFGINPLSPEISFNVNADYASDAELKKISGSLEENPDIEEIALPDSEMVENMNHNIEAFAIVLGVIALAMVVISFVLINNTVHLAIYARRFTIHTMQLVGATNGFIRTPMVLSNMAAGALAGLIASGILAIALVAAPKAGFENIDQYISWPLYACVAGGVIVTGTLLCGFAAGIATTRYLAKDYEDLFK